jgi:DNA-binding transcriptional LysR family regulator
MINLRQIEAFRAVIETGTVSRAAERLLVSQPAVSKLLTNLEHATGLSLFDRRRGRLSPTPEALLLFDEMERVFQGVVRIDRFAKEIRTLQHGSLRIGVMPALSTGVIHDIVAHILVDRPKLNISVHARTTPKIVEWLAAGHLDVGLTSHDIDHPELSILPLCRHAWVCIMPRGHRLALKKVVRPKDLDGETFISFTGDTVTRRELDAIFDQAGVHRQMNLSAPMAPTICAMVAHGLGVALVDPLYIAELAPLLETRPFRPTVETELRILLPKHKPLSLVVNAFIDAARTLIGGAAA